MKYCVYGVLFIFLGWGLWSCNTKKKDPDSQKSPILPPQSVPSKVKTETAEIRLKRWIRGLKHPDPKLRLDMLTRIAEEEIDLPSTVLKTLGAYLLREENETVWLNLRDYLWKKNQVETILFLSECLRDLRIPHRIQSVKLLKEWHPPAWDNALAELAKKEHDQAAPYAAVLLGTEKALAHIDLLQQMIQRDNYLDPPLAIDILAPLILQHPPIKTFLLETMSRHPSSPVRRNCVKILGPRLSIEEILPALKDEEGNVRFEVVAQLISHSEPNKSVPYLVQIANNIEHRPDIRQKAAMGLFILDSTQAIQVCSLLLLQTFDEVRMFAITLLLKNDPQEMCWIGEAILSSDAEKSLALQSPQIEQFPQFALFLKPLEKAEDYKIASRVKHLLQFWKKFSEGGEETLFASPTQTFELFKNSSSRYCLRLSRECFSQNYLKNNPSYEKTIISLQNQNFQKQYQTLIQQLAIISIQKEETKATGTLARGVILFVKENGLWKIDAIQLQ